MTEPAIEVNNLTRRFGKTVAVDQLSLEVPPGKIFGFLGENGAGKTTTIRTLMGLLRPSAGSVRVLGPLSTPQIICLVGLAVAIAALVRNRRVSPSDLGERKATWGNHR